MVLFWLYFCAADGAEILFGEPLFDAGSVVAVEASQSQHLFPIFVLTQADLALLFVMVNLARISCNLKFVNRKLL